MPCCRFDVCITPIPEGASKRILALIGYLWSWNDDVLVAPVFMDALYKGRLAIQGTCVVQHSDPQQDRGHVARIMAQQGLPGMVSVVPVGDGFKTVNFDPTAPAPIWSGVTPGKLRKRRGKMPRSQAIKVVDDDE